MNHGIPDRARSDDSPPPHDPESPMPPEDGLIDSAADIDPAMSRGTGSRDDHRGGVQPDPDKT